MPPQHSERRNSELPVIRLTSERQIAKRPFAQMAAHGPSLPNGELCLMFTPPELASHLRVTTRTIRRWVLSGILPEPLQIGSRSPRWRRSTIECCFPQNSFSNRQTALRDVPTVTERNEA